MRWIVSCRTQPVMQQVGDVPEMTFQPEMNNMNARLASSHPFQLFINIRFGGRCNFRIQTTLGELGIRHRTRFSAPWSCANTFIVCPRSPAEQSISYDKCIHLKHSKFYGREKHVTEPDVDKNRAGVNLYISHW